MSEELNQIAVVETMTLKKFDGELTEEQIESGEFEPVEVIVVNGAGEVIEHYTRED